MSKLDTRLARLAGWLLQSKVVVGDIFDSKTIFQLAGWVTPADYAALIYCLIHGCDPDTLKGDALEEALKDPSARDAFEAKEVMEAFRLEKPKGSELTLRFPIEVLKKYKGNLKNFSKVDQDKIVWMSQATIAVVLYMRALRDARNMPVRSEGYEDMAHELSRESYQIQSQIENFWGSLWSQDEKGETQQKHEPPEVIEAKHDTYAKLLKDDQAFMDKWVEYEVQHAVHLVFVLDTLEGPKLAAKDAWRLVEQADVLRVLKNATENAKKQWMQLTVPGLDSPEGKDLVDRVKDMRDWVLDNDAQRVEHHLNKEVPVTLVWAAAKKGGK